MVQRDNATKHAREAAVVVARGGKGFARAAFASGDAAFEKDHPLTPDARKVVGALEQWLHGGSPEKAAESLERFAELLEKE